MQVNKGKLYTDKQYIELLKNHIRLLLKENEYKEKVIIKQEERIDKAIKILESKKHCERLCGGIDGKTFTEQTIDILKGEENEKE